LNICTETTLKLLIYNFVIGYKSIVMDLKSNEPFWLIKNGVIKSYPSLKENISCDVLVVGGGITGSLIAHQCVQDGFRTVMIDKREIANGSSSATTSMLQYEIDTPLYKLIEMVGPKGAVASYKACSQAIEQLGEIAHKLKSKAGFIKKDSLYFAALKKDVAWLTREFEARKKVGFDVKWMEADDVLKKYNLQKAYGGILSKQGASIDAFLFVHEMLAYNVKKGLEVYDKTELANVTYKVRQNEVALNTGAKIKCKKIVYCVGYESATMIKEKFVDLVSTYAIVSEMIPEESRKYKDVLLWNTADPYHYMRTTDDGRMLIGGEDEEFRNPQQRDSLIGNKEQKLLKSVEKYLPNLPFYPNFAWAGTFGTTKDSLPYIGEHK